MKKVILSIAMAALLGFVGCKKDDDTYIYVMKAHIKVSHFAPQSIGHTYWVVANNDTLLKTVLTDSSRTDNFVVNVDVPVTFTVESDDTSSAPRQINVDVSKDRLLGGQIVQDLHTYYIPNYWKLVINI